MRTTHTHITFSLLPVGRDQRTSIKLSITCMHTYLKACTYLRGLMYEYHFHHGGMASNLYTA